MMEALLECGSVVVSCCSVIQSFSHVQPFVTPWTAAHQASLYASLSPEI